MIAALGIRTDGYLVSQTHECILPWWQTGNDNRWLTKIETSSIEYVSVDSIVGRCGGKDDTGGDDDDGGGIAGHSIISHRQRIRYLHNMYKSFAK